MKRILQLVAVVVALTACGGDQAQLAYQPAAYGVPGQCYYVESPLEVTSLYAHHLCPSTWAPTPMPLWWHTRYAGYYDSPSYYGTYVPASSRTIYVQHVHTFESTNAGAIRSASTNGTWKGSDGKTVSGAQVAGDVKSGKAGFSGGARGGFSGGGTGAAPKTGGSSGAGGAKDSGSGGSVKSGSSGFSGGSRGGSGFSGGGRR
jgi:hypothetical protein